MHIKNIVVLVGGVGGARFTRGLVAELERRHPSPDDRPRVTAIVNTGDDSWIAGLRVTPDLDSMMYTLAGVGDDERGWGLRDESYRVSAELEKYGVGDLEKQSGMRLNALSCVALPTCGLALAESERALPGLLDHFEKILDEVGLHDEPISLRITGCPNGCARPYMAEIAFVGKAPGRYQIWLGGDVAGMRLNRMWKDMVKDPEIENELRPVLARFAKERSNGERFGDWCDRVLLKEEPVAAN